MMKTQQMSRSRKTHGWEIMHIMLLNKFFCDTLVTTRQITPVIFRPRGNKSCSYEIRTKGQSPKIGCTGGRRLDLN